ncbi:MAG: dihydroxyacetone kinase subunit DhaK [Firmicutes bacterium]|uniref:Dihydroxyacetone kinase subunit DhaK n=1 Tax=Sulfobacillus benefaciens TaxID=453960 RepID=A0A2T2X4A6_9FIRM|nr:dihydroxyacetone kinase subunit DhaK [Bacillota bacterium]MCL5013959.1 dihydroxyacetone kinase subunit DhaK [Bacillota bacterium]PSR29322.1 MAG: dihydroxyacetone kinase subunit DhaK [Sulfobacillus benefaciens]
MKKLLDRVEAVVDDMLDGLAWSFPDYLRRIPQTRVMTRARPKDLGKVGIVSGGGSGHEPAHSGYVGFGMLDAAVAGEVFTSPTPDQILEGIRVADRGAGVLLIIKNYTGDVMNFEIAKDMASAEGILTEAVIVNDDVAVEDSLFTTGRRGIAGTILVHKIAGALAEDGCDLTTVSRGANTAIQNLRSMGFALAPCTPPAAGQPSFTLAENEMEMGIGIHGEPGTRRQPVQPARDLADYVLSRIVEDLQLKAGDSVACLINGMGATPLMELAILAKDVSMWLQNANIPCNFALMGEYMTSLEMAGASVTLLRLRDDLERWLKAPCDTPAMRQGVMHER